MKRLVAVVVAIGLIVGAAVVRGIIDDDDDDNGGDGRRDGDGELVIVCASELASACERLDLDVTVEDAAVTAAGLSGTAPPTIDVWAVFDPWPAIVDDTRMRAGLDPLFTGGEPVARSPFVAIGTDAVSDCDWRCLGDRAAGGLKVGARPLESGAGTLQLGAAAAGWFGGPDFATNDFDASFDSWLDGLTSAVIEDESPVERLLQSRAFFDVALSFEAEAKAELGAASADRSAGLQLLYPAPVAYLQVVVVDVARDGGADEFRGDIGEALLADGWQAAADEPSGLPSPGVLIALRGLV